MEITLIKTLSGTLKPAFDSDYDNFKKIPLNEPISFKWTKQRNPAFHKKFFALVNMVYQNQEHYNNSEKMRNDLTVEAGYYTDETNYLTGEISRKPKSIAFDKMDDLEFSEFYNRFIDAIINWLKWERDDILENIEQYF